MSIAFDTAGTPNAGSSNTASLPRAGTLNDLIIAVIAFEGVTAGSGPWITPNTGQFTADYIGPSEGWKRCAWQAPSATGVGMEIWAAINGTLIGTSHAQLTSSLNWVTVQAYYSGIYEPTDSITDGAVRAAVSAQVTGDDPAAPSVYAYVDELIVVCAGDTLSGGFSAPTGYTQRTDHARSGAGTVEAAIADAPVTTEGDTGTIPFVGSASPSGAKGVTATLAIRPVPPGSSSPLIAVEFSVAG